MELFIDKLILIINIYMSVNAALHTYYYKKLKGKKRFQKQPPEVFCKKRCSQTFRKIHRKTSVPGSHFLIKLQVSSVFIYKTLLNLALESNNRQLSIVRIAKRTHVFVKGEKPQQNSLSDFQNFFSFSLNVKGQFKMRVS